MKCPKCNVELSIFKARYEAEDDESAETKTKIYLVQDFKCRNKGCADYDKIVFTDRTLLN